MLSRARRGAWRGPKRLLRCTEAAMESRNVHRAGVITAGLYGNKASCLAALVARRHHCACKCFIHWDAAPM
eukprot:1807767-Lingulodinium_polyedra.AAC.1